VLDAMSLGLWVPAASTARSTICRTVWSTVGSSTARMATPAPSPPCSRTHARALPPANCIASSCSGDCWPRDCTAPPNQAAEPAASSCCSSGSRSAHSAQSSSESGAAERRKRRA
jgi:hypothetical protein